jgi:hypothetical protein
MPEKRLRGAKVKGTLQVPGNTQTLAEYETEVWDSHQFFRPNTSRTALKVHRQELDGRYQIRVAVRWMNPWQQQGDPLPDWDTYKEMEFVAQLQVNGNLVGNDARATSQPVLKATGTTQYFAVNTDLRRDDVVELQVFQTVGPLVNATAFLEILRMGPPVESTGP